MRQDNVLYVFVADKAQIALAVGDVTTLAEGNVGVADLDGTLIAVAPTSTQKVRLVKKVGGVLQFSPELTTNDVVVKTSSTYVADSQFTGYLGYNGVDGDIPAIIDTVYTPKLIVKDSLTTFGNKAFIKEAVYKTPRTAPVFKGDIVSGLAINFAKNMAREPEKFVTIEVVTSDAGVAMVAGALAAGSNVATVDAADTVGSWLKAVTGEAYKIISKTTATTAVLDRESSVTDIAPTYIDSATAQADATKWGLWFTGVARTNFKAGIWKHMVYDFDLIGGANMESVQITVTHAKLGICTNEGVAEEEWFAQGNRGYGDRIDSIPVATQVTAQMTGADYNGLYLQSKLQQFTSVVGQSPASLVEDKVYGSAALITVLKTVFGI